MALYVDEDAHDRTSGSDANTMDLDAWLRNNLSERTYGMIEFRIHLMQTPNLIVSQCCRCADKLIKDILRDDRARKTKSNKPLKSRCKVTTQQVQSGTDFPERQVSVVTPVTGSPYSTTFIMHFLLIVSVAANIIFIRSYYIDFMQNIDSFALDTFQWDGSRGHRNLLISNNMTAISYILFNRQHHFAEISIVSKNILSADSFTFVRWEVKVNPGKILQISNPHVNDDGLLSCGFQNIFKSLHWFSTGYIAVDDIGKFDPNALIGHKKNQVAVDMIDTQETWIIDSGSYYTFQEEQYPKLLDGFKDNRFELQFDFKNHRCFAVYNVQLGIVSNNLPDSIYLAASLYVEGMVIETTLFEGL